MDVIVIHTCLFLLHPKNSSTQLRMHVHNIITLEIHQKHTMMHL